ncbi:MAG: hypothetical protein ACLTXM_07140 [Enterococcus sp.]
MKKWLVLAAMVAVLAGCGSGGAKEASESTTSKLEVSSSEKKIKLKAVDFQVEGTAYKMKIIDNWKVLEDEGFSFSAENEDKVEGIMVYGLKKMDIDNFDVFKTAMRERMISTKEFQIKEETIKEESYQTTHFKGDLYSFMGTYEGVNAEVRFYLLETEEDYVFLNIIGLPSFFVKKGNVVNEMLNSFVTG